MLTAARIPDAARTLLASGRICAEAKYQGMGFTPWDSNVETHRNKLTSATFAEETLTDLFYCFSGCSSLTTIYADSTWTLPSSGISGSQCFYSCNSLVGGNGTVWSSSNTGYTYSRIDTASTPGYIMIA